MPRDGVVIVDEASMVPTLVLDEMVRAAGVYGSKITLIGDFADARSRWPARPAGLPSAVELTCAPLQQSWEADVSLQPRRAPRRPRPTCSMADRGVEYRQGVRRCRRGWWADTAQGHRSLVVVDTAGDAADVSTRRHTIRCRRRLGDHVADAADGCRIHVGDLIQPAATRVRFTPATIVGSSTVMWTVIGIDADGTVEVRHALRTRIHSRLLRRRRRRARLRHDDRRSPGPHRRLGHVVVTPRTSAASLYVGMSRGREQPRPRRVRQPRPHRVRTRRPHRRTSLRRGDAARPRRPALRPHGPAAWDDGRADRFTARAGDRSRRQITDWWTKRQRSLPPAVLAAIAPRHHQILDVLYGSRTRPGGTRSSEPPPPRSTGVVPTPRIASSGRLRRAATATPVDHDRATHEHSAHQQR